MSIELDNFIKVNTFQSIGTNEIKQAEMQYWINTINYLTNSNFKNREEIESHMRVNPRYCKSILNKYIKNIIYIPSYIWSYYYIFSYIGSIYYMYRYRSFIYFFGHFLF